MGQAECRFFFPILHIYSLSLGAEVAALLRFWYCKVPKRTDAASKTVNNTYSRAFTLSPTSSPLSHLQVLVAMSCNFLLVWISYSFFES